MELSGDTIIQERQKKILSFLKQKWEWLSYLLLAIVVGIAVFIRTRNIPGLKDVSTNDWTLGPDLDPFLFLRWSKYIVEHGSLFVNDLLRYVPIGFNTTDELVFHPYMMAWFHKIASLFGSESVTYSAIIYPVFFFAITVIAFYFFTSEVFKDKVSKSWRIAISLVASLFLSILPGILPRTIAGIPEKESAAFFFLFAAFLLYIKSWRAEKVRNAVILSVLTGLATAGMALIWGGFIYIFVTISLTTFLAFFFGQVTNKRAINYGVWLLTSSVVMSMYSTRYSFTNLFVSATTGFAFFVLAMMIVGFSISKIKSKFNLVSLERRLYSKEVFTFVSTVVLIFVFASFLFGPGFIFAKLGDISNALIKPVNDRLGVTVAENKQPYFDEWAGNFGPNIKGIPIFFWLFVIGSVHLFYKMMHHFPKRERIIAVSGYSLFIFTAIFSRYGPNNLFNGENAISILFYAFGAIVLAGSLGYVYVQQRKNNLNDFQSVDFGYLLTLVFFFFGIVSARGSVRTIMMLIPPASIVVGHFIGIGASVIYERASSKNKHSGVALVFSGLIIVAAIFAAYSFYSVSISTAKSYIPSVYTNQWQNAMGWVRENTPENAVFSHWWDYGYWVQSIGERATVLDGGNSYAYWNHMLGRHVLTGNDSQLALDFLYAHNATHLLIDSTDIGKYGAFSSIGSDENYDRRSWITTFTKDPSSTRESKNKTTYVYGGGFSLDQDVIFEDETGETILLPGANNQNTDEIKTVAGLGAIITEFSTETIMEQPKGVYVFQNKQYNLPIRYAFIEGELVDFGSGVEAGVVFIPRVVEQGIDVTGTIIYLSERVVHSQLARLYIYQEEDPNFRVAHHEEDYVVTQIKKQGLQIGNFVDYQGVRGPITIWEINYPRNITLNREYLQIDYPRNLRNA